MRDDFAVLIITHARPETQPTQKALKKVGYTGRVILILDDEDETRAEYIRRYGEENIRIFSKDAVCFDTMDNFHKQKKGFGVCSKCLLGNSEAGGVTIFFDAR